METRKNPPLLAVLHPRQSERVAALRAYDILDTPRESDFDEIVQLASEICGVPISVVNLIDTDRQWFKAEVGLGVRETPLDTSICSHAILDQDFVEIPDTLDDRRMQDNPLCTDDPGLRFYAGALLATPQGLPLGTLCVLDFKPRTLTPLQRNALRVLAKQVMAQLDLRLALKHQLLLQKEIDHRVKNSLANVGALVGLQITRAKDAGVRAALSNVEQRLRTISLIHEELYRSGESDAVDPARYLSNLCTMLQGNAASNVSLQAQATSPPINSTTASALGIIVTEFVMNSQKYAFPHNRAGKISVLLEPLDADTLVLLCSDDGVGLRKRDTDKPGLGIRLIEAYAAQLGGRAELRNAGPGFGLRVVFPK